MLGLPAEIRACLFDLDGVLTKTARLHAEAWKHIFDSYLLARAKRTGEPFVPFDAIADYDRSVDGRPREDGTRAFLATRGIRLPPGTPDDPPGAETTHGLAIEKNRLFVRLLHERGVTTYPDAIRYLRAARDAKLRTAVVSSSRNCCEVVLKAGLADLFDVRVDGEVAGEQHLQGKPAPDTYLAAARMLELDATRCAVFEDALSGVQAGRAGEFGFVVGVDRRGQAAALRARGANVVIADFAELLGTP